MKQLLIILLIWVSSLGPSEAKQFDSLDRFIDKFEQKSKQKGMKLCRYPNLEISIKNAKREAQRLNYRVRAIESEYNRISDSTNISRYFRKPKFPSRKNKLTKA